MKKATGKIVLVTGATGFLGSYVLPELKKAGFGLKCLVRNKADAKLLESAGAQVVYGDVRDKSSLTQALRGTDAVLHMAAVLKSSSKKLYYDVNQYGTKNLVDACVENKVRRFIHISTHDVTFERGDYSLSKLKGEEVVKNSKLDFTIFRPADIYGRGECALSGMARLIKSLPVVPIPGKGDAKLQPAYAGDVATAIAKAISNSKSIGKTYFIAGPDQIAFEELVDSIMGELGIKKAKVHVPLAVVKPLVRVYEKVAGNPFMTTDSLELFTRDKTCDYSPAARDLGYSPMHLKDGVKIMLSKQRL
jgi:nucleoside-diphosphate-sugar epimerase